MKQENTTVVAPKQYQSVFVPEHLIDLPNFIAELMIRNWLLINKKPVPNCPFWRKDIASQSVELTDLAKRYVTEVAAARNLLKVFGPGVIMKYYQENKMPGFTMLTNETKGKVLLELFKRQIKAKEAIIQLEQETIQKGQPVTEAPPIPTIWNTEAPVATQDDHDMLSVPSTPSPKKTNRFNSL